ncbi:MAG TPA: protein kinase [Thermoanaerobaculia bacterium]|nr:protein kinase [Thermoanaerobaculia bacterium]
MTLTPGTHLGPYEILAPLGAGGMGEVFRARDTRLEREVAVKVLPEEVASDPERLRRFEREARAVAALSHPNVLAIHDVAREGEAPYVVTELLEGQTLREALRQGPLPLARALDQAAQIARGLAAAHERGIVHRDLKPENVFVTRGGLVKILDFGLARLEPEPQAPTTQLRTQTLATGPGVLLGTAGYMAPEQVRGEPADHRADLFAFGCLLYEMLAGRRAFQRDSAVQTMNAILEAEPEPLPRAQPGVPPPVRWIVERCLAKDREQRYQATGDLVRNLEDVRAHLSEISSVAPADAPPRAAARRRLTPWLAAAAAASAGVALLLLLVPRHAPSEPPAVSYLTYSGRDSAPAVSPDGRLVAFTSSRDGTHRIWLKQLAGGSEAPLTAGPDHRPRFAPDGASLLFVRDQGDGTTALYRVATLGGEPRKVLDDVGAADWAPDGESIVYVRRGDRAGRQVSFSLELVRPDGSGARVLAEDLGGVLTTARWSPDGERIAVIRAGTQSGTPHALLVLDRDGRELASTSLGTQGVGSLSWTADGRAILFPLLSAISAGGAPTGSSRLQLWRPGSGRSRTILRLADPTLAAVPAGAGRLVLEAVSPRQSLREESLDGSAPPRWLTRGHSTDRQPAYSPDGDSIVFSSYRGGNLDLWTVDRHSGAVRRLTDDPTEDWDPAFTPDGRHVVWSSRRGGHFEVWMAGRDGSGARQVSRDGVDAENPTVSPDGAWIVYNSGNPGGPGVWKVRSNGRDAMHLAEGATLVPEVSPDGRHVLYLVNPQLLQRAIRVVRLEDGAAVDFEIELELRRGSLDALDVGRARWMPGGDAIAFLAYDEDGVAGIFVQDFASGRDTSDTRRKLAGFERDGLTETFGIAPDGARITLSIRDTTSSLMLVDNVPGLGAGAAGGR